MFKVWVITFEDGKQSVMRTRIVGGHQVELMTSDGDWYVVKSIPWKFTATEIKP